MTTPTLLRRRALGVATAALAAPHVVSGVARAQDTWPTRPVIFTNHFPVGGGVDTLVRIVCAKLSELTGQPFVVQTKTGATGTIGASVVANSSPDGYSIGTMNFASHAVSPHRVKDLPYAVLPKLRGITPVAMLFSQATVLVIRDNTPAKDLREFIELVRLRPAQHFKIANTGIGSTSWLCAQSFKRLANVDLIDIGYKGDAEALPDLLNGTVDAYFGTTTAVLPQIAAGKLRALGVSSSDRNAAFPDIPPVGSILAGFRCITWNGICGPERVPTAIVERIATLAMEVLRSSDILTRFREHGVTPMPLGPAETTRFLVEEATAVQPLLAAAGIEPVK